MTLLEWGILALIIMVVELRTAVWRQNKCMSVVALECRNPDVRKKLAKILLIVIVATAIGGCFATRSDAFRVTRRTNTADGWIEQEQIKKSGEVNTNVDPSGLFGLGAGAATALGGGSLATVALGLFLNRKRKLKLEEGADDAA